MKMSARRACDDEGPEGMPVHTRLDPDVAWTGLASTVQDWSDADPHLLKTMLGFCQHDLISGRLQHLL